jgi:hypothetical protein
VHAVQAQYPSHRGELVDERLDRPQRRVVWTVGSSAAQLVIADDGTTGLRQDLQRLELIAGRSWPAVQQQEREPARRGMVQVANDSVPGTHAPKRDEPLGHWSGHFTSPPVLTSDGAARRHVQEQSSRGCRDLEGR